MPITADQVRMVGEPVAVGPDVEPPPPRAEATPRAGVSLWLIGGAVVLYFLFVRK